ncbi:hypothetical protein LDENG_00116970 [Lucifuga dentata]|nr:hypothetical protein LDENG_00116970 [Lucifuga dentata]
MPLFHLGLTTVTHCILKSTSCPSVNYSRSRMLLLGLTCTHSETTSPLYSPLSIGFRSAIGLILRFCYLFFST